MTGTTAERLIVVGVDTSQACLPAARWAAMEAVRTGATLKLFHASVFWIDDQVPAHDGSDADQEMLMEQGFLWVHRAAGAASAAAPEVRIENVVRLGLAVDMLVAESAGADMIVLGSHGIGGLRGVMTGSVSLRVAAEALCAVVVVRGSAPPPHGPVVVGVDATVGSDCAVEFAIEAAVAREVPLLALHAWHDALLDPELIATVEDTRQRRALEHRMTAWAAKYPGVDIRLHSVRSRHPARELLRIAPDAQLIVVGSRRRGPVAGGLLGSTGNFLVSHSACAVAIAHHREPPVRSRWSVARHSGALR
jgi:nucleotide-binding universal stress UspA family protein